MVAAEASGMIDSSHPAVTAFAAEVVSGAADDRESAVRLYYAVRDRFRYDPYTFDLTVDGLKASTVIARGTGWCVPKAALLAAACRAVGIPARVGLADVRNHLSTERLRKAMGTDMFYGHGYTTMQIGGVWYKATPAFNIELCERMRLHPLDFDGQSDSLYHPFTLDGARHMEYVTMRGEFDEIPREMILKIFAEHYRGMVQLGGADWDADVLAESAKDA